MIAAGAAAAPSPWHSAPVVRGAAGWLAGTLVTHALPRLPDVHWLIPVVLAVLVSLRFAAARFALCALAALVWTVWCADARLAARLPPEQSGDDFALTGWIDGFPTAAPGQTTFSLTVAAPRPAGVPPRVRLTWYDAPTPLAAGDSLELVARLRTPHGNRNPGGFDYERWLLVTEHGATGYVRSGKVTATTANAGVARAWVAFRWRLATGLAALAPDDDAAALLVALAVGERYRFEQRHWDDFRQTGTSHLVAVSGTHVGLIGLFAFFVLRRSWLRLPPRIAVYDLEAAALASAVCTIGYAALTGFAVPAQRSMLMILVTLALLVSRRRVGGWQGLAAALWAVLLWDPFAPLAASFWLSFVAVALLLLLAAPRALPPPRVSAPHRVLTGARGLLVLQWGIGIALLPLAAAFFGQISVVGPLVNLAAIPWFNFVLVPLTLVAALLVAMNAVGAAVVVHVAGVLASVTVAALHALAAIPWAAVAVPVPLAALVVAACGVAFALAAPPLRGRRLAWLAVLPLFRPALDVPPVGAARLVVLDVGQGLAAIVETRSHRLLFDTGPSFPSGFDTGEEVVLPALAAGGRRDLDLLIVSHADNDHAGGAAAVVAAFPHAAVLRGPDVAALTGPVCERGQSWSWDGVRFEILHPPPGFDARGNESSCVLRVTAGGRSALLTGDIEARGEAAVRAAGNIDADFVVVPHHGSATSSSPAFVHAAGAALAIVPAGFANRWGFPKPAVRRRWEESGAAVIVTSDLGAVTVSFGGAAPTLRTERDVRHHYWESKPAQRADLSW